MALEGLCWLWKMDTTEGRLRCRGFSKRAQSGAERTCEMYRGSTGFGFGRMRLEGFWGFVCLNLKG